MKLLNYEYTILHTEASEIRSVGVYSVTSVTGPPYTYLILSLPHFTTFSSSPPLPLSFCTSLSLSLPTLALCFLAFAAPTSADYVAHLQVLGDEHLRLLHMVLTFNQVVCMVINGHGMRLTCNWGGGGEANRMYNPLWLVWVYVARPE